MQKTLRSVTLLVLEDRNFYRKREGKKIRALEKLDDE